MGWVHERGSSGTWNWRFLVLTDCTLHCLTKPPVRSGTRLACSTHTAPDSLVGPDTGLFALAVVLPRARDERVRLGWRVRPFRARALYSFRRADAVLLHQCRCGNRLSLTAALTTVIILDSAVEMQNWHNAIRATSINLLNKLEVRGIVRSHFAHAAFFSRTS